jgi:hypothetical protein
MSAHALRLPFSLDHLMAEAKRRMRHGRVLVALLIIVAAGAVVAATLRLSGGPTQTGPMRRYTFTVKAVNASLVVNDVSYVSLSSPVALSQKKLARTPLFDITGGFYLTKASARGSVLCSFAKRIMDSITFPKANGKTVAVTVYGKRAPASLTARICAAFKSFSLSYVPHN